MNKIKLFLKSGSFDHFFHFFTVFTSIFVIMTFIILQIMRFGVYSTVDNSLNLVAKHSTLYADKAMEQISLFNFDNQNFNEATSRYKSSLITDPVGNTDIILYSADGTILNPFDAFSNLNYFKLNPHQLNKIVTQKKTNFYGHEEKFHTVTIKVQSNNYPAVSYLSAVANVDQLDRANERYENIIILVMSIFWLISIFASIYLAYWSRKPIVESFEKQKSFVENASHELRTPLAVLQNRLESLFRKPNETILENSEAIASSLEEVRNMRILTTNLLNLARRDDGIDVKKEEIGASFFDPIFENYKLIAEENGIKFQSFNEVSYKFVTDKALLKQLITILFDNAVKYTAENGNIVILVKTTEKSLLLRVSDNGIGISNSDKERIFDRFYRVDKARTRQIGGFGLGLALAKQIVVTLKGDITVKDNFPQGTIFQVKL
ncbi:sensor histidine kinase [Streptococcus parauberis]|uniref:sensor histidine kinase n=1 Tax=Streptococcus parauberis TaxID=1348 RepID=UPI0002BB6CAC|nr:HAMP domain-containing sensor histidine kinase [Streptococcus parauberis]EMF49917.1 Two component system sensor histidine kinase [Streptococcus parauberis KRS-02109]KYP17014.1 Signal transduction histidine-protein kinase ArlS [Streptococcus parauberis]KYP18187.1 Signal transduction histidine-protein kinase ArlS [Streptococcus parauberis]KYP20396.1 Signal transduction histidine-protein kinase ArlS [Streptococcus parauberis]KYP24764.1 Signal transduction histidine-protein kinase ArlS [Strepto